MSKILKTYSKEVSCLSKHKQYLNEKFYYEISKSIWEQIKEYKNNWKVQFNVNIVSFMETITKLQTEKCPHKANQKIEKLKYVIRSTLQPK